MASVFRQAVTLAVKRYSSQQLRNPDLWPLVEMICTMAPRRNSQAARQDFGRRVSAHMYVETAVLDLHAALSGWPRVRAYLERKGSLFVHQICKLVVLGLASSSPPRCSLSLVCTESTM